MGLKWCAEDFIGFVELLERPDGHGRIKLEGFQRLIINEIFAPKRVEMLCMLPKGSGKTLLMAALGVFHILVTHNAQVFVGASDKIQASEMYRAASHFVMSEPEIGQRLKVLGGTMEIRSKSDQGFIRVLASDDSKVGGRRQGFNPTLALVDELHSHTHEGLYLDLRTGLFKRHGVLVNITTAGWDQESVLGKLRANFLEADQNGGTVERSQTATDDGEYRRDHDGRLTVARIGRNVMLEWAARADDDIDDVSVVELCNPASWTSRESLQDAKDAPGISPWAFARYFANRWTIGYDSWIPVNAWDALYSSAVPVVEHRYWNDATDAELDAYVDSLYPEGTEIVGFIDMARYRDCAAITLIGPGPGARLLPRAIVWKGSQDAPISYGPVYRAVRRLDARYGLAELGLDPKYLDEMYETLDGEGVAVVEAPQSNERMAPAASNLRQAILTDAMFEHDGDPILAAHIMAATAKDIGTESFKLVKSKANGPPIDACVALAGALALVDTAEPVEPLVDWGDA